IGCPHDGPSQRRSNKNNVDDLSSWLAAYHPGHFLVWNITDQTAGTGGGGGNGNGGGQVLDVPWESPQLKCPVPTLNHLLRVCYSIKVGL
ncbi:unnamed protein product, partial [Discosporangium mesarthrocarpum]